MAKKFPIVPLHPERICWGCDTYCPADSLMCGNGTVRTPHPSEMFGEDWMDWGLDAGQEQEQETVPASTGDQRFAGEP
jgi:hypothetical protein